jgi:hypothetical protein
MGSRTNRSAGVSRPGQHALQAPVNQQEPSGTSIVDDDTSSYESSSSSREKDSIKQNRKRWRQDPDEEALESEIANLKQRLGSDLPVHLPDLPRADQLCELRCLCWEQSQYINEVAQAASVAVSTSAESRYGTLAFSCMGCYAVFSKRDYLRDHVASYHKALWTIYKPRSNKGDHIGQHLVIAFTGNLGLEHFLGRNLKNPLVDHVSDEEAEIREVPLADILEKLKVTASYLGCQVAVSTHLLW